MTKLVYSPIFRYIHFSLIVFGISSYLTAELVEEAGIWGFWTHSILGFLLGITIIIRLMFGISSHNELSLSKWFDVIFKKADLIKEDIKILFGLSMPERSLHEGIAGIVQMFGLLIFSWMSITGTVLFFIENHIFSLSEDLFEELHEIGEILIPIYLIIHIGAVFLHYIKGENLLNRINPFKK